MVGGMGEGVLPVSSGHVLTMLFIVMFLDCETTFYEVEETMIWCTDC